MIWARVSSQSWLFWLYRASPSLAKRIYSIWFRYWPSADVHVSSHLLCCWQRVFLWPVHSHGKTLLAFALLYFVLQSQTCLLFQISLDFLLLHSKPLQWKGHLFFGVSSIKVKVKSLNHVWLFATPWTVACQAPPSLGFSRQGCWSGLPFPSPGRSSISSIRLVQKHLWFQTVNFKPL